MMNPSQKPTPNSAIRPAVLMQAARSDGRSSTLRSLVNSKSKAAKTAAVITSAMSRRGILSAANTPTTLPSVAGIAASIPARQFTSDFAWKVRKRHE